MAEALLDTLDTGDVLLGDAYYATYFLLCKSAAMADCLPRELSFKHSLQLWLAWRQFADGLEEDLVDLLCLIVQQRVSNRAGRAEPRALKRRPKPYPLLTPIGSRRNQEERSPQEG